MLTTRPSNSIIHQSFQSHRRKEPLNGDGFGLAWYVPEVSTEPAQFRSIQPAWNNVNLLHLARVTRSPVAMVHVRAATEGIGVSESNCHPFTSGPFAFMHNGVVAGFPAVKREMSRRLTDEGYLSIHGTTDSELLFALFRERFARCQIEDRTEAMAHALVGTIGEVAEIIAKLGQHGFSYLNLAVTDGQSAVVSRYASGEAESPSLYLSTGAQCICDGGSCRMIQCAGERSAVIVASEPLNDDPEWRPVAHNHLLSIRPDLTTDDRRIS